MDQGTNVADVGQEQAQTSDSSTGEWPVQLTAKALEMVRDAMEREGLEGHGLRVSVMGGGCSGLQYGLDFESEERMMDLTWEQDGVKIFIDTMSQGYLEGVTIDYVTGMQGAGFKFLNPTASRTCGCGSSFSA